jgi:hypothetical protein
MKAGLLIGIDCFFNFFVRTSEKGYVNPNPLSEMVAYPSCIEGERKIRSDTRLNFIPFFSDSSRNIFGAGTIESNPSSSGADDTMC